MIRIILYIILFILLSTGNIYCQARYWISFNSKDNTPYSISNPQEFLAERSIERRQRQGIAITETDLPVDPAFVDSLENLGVRVISVSRWLNGALIESGDESVISSLSSLEFINDEPFQVLPHLPDKAFQSLISREKTSVQPIEISYGASDNQIKMLNGDYLHSQGTNGEGMLIAILDAGFTSANQISSLAHVWNQDRVITTKDFVKDELTIFNSHHHGTLVFSIIAGIEENILYGSAPAADFALIRTEDGGSEYLIEEYNWLIGAEFADSLGADIINSSLGYSLFDDSLQNHVYAEFDGNTTIAAKAAKLAAERGILIVASAGNAGNKVWYHILTPADARDILTVGAVDSLKNITSFSSRGPSFDNRVKPDVCAQGHFTVGQYPSGSFIRGSGTSLSAPLITGMAACLWQRNPQAGIKDIIDAFHRSSDHYFNPDSLYGYGIPDMPKADILLTNSLRDSLLNPESITLFPNPANNQVYLNIIQPDETGIQTITVNIFDLQGRLYKSEKHLIESSNFVLNIRNLEILNTGIYVMQVIQSKGAISLPLFKI